MRLNGRFAAPALTVSAHSERGAWILQKATIKSTFPGKCTVSRPPAMLYLWDLAELWGVRSPAPSNGPKTHRGWGFHIKQVADRHLRAWAASQEISCVATQDRRDEFRLTNAPFWGFIQRHGFLNVLTRVSKASENHWRGFSAIPARKSPS